jgi:hypothetical protein
MGIKCVGWTCRNHMGVEMGGTSFRTWILIMQHLTKEREEKIRQYVANSIFEHPVDQRIVEDLLLEIDCLRANLIYVQNHNKDEWTRVLREDAENP